ncbi:DUF6358 family protein [Arcticibacter eurypsychrophilus]|uniref:DUF6358 family protein n=1 Tax=Arcticibacter eurypsychrophilus TaxID=1434752 RepID=UPI00084D3525
MGKKIFLNVLYNLALIILVLCVFWSAKDGQYAITLGSVFISAFIIFLKIKLKKEVTELIKKRNNKI